jgi:hypothetical protein
MNTRGQAIDPAAQKLAVFISSVNIEAINLEVWERQFLSGYICPHRSGRPISGESEAETPTNAQECEAV